MGDLLSAGARALSRGGNKPQVGVLAHGPSPSGFYICQETRHLFVQQAALARFKPTNKIPVDLTEAWGRSQVFTNWAKDDVFIDRG